MRLSLNTWQVEVAFDVDVVDDPTVLAAKLNSDFERICDWEKRWPVTINASKTKWTTFSVKRFKPFHPFVLFDNEVIDEVMQHTHPSVPKRHAC